MNSHHSRSRICIFWLLAFIEFFERYGFYVVNALFIILLTKHMGWSENYAYSYVATTTSLFYLGPLIGGWITDHYLNNKFSLTFGSIFLCSGYILLAFWKSIGINLGMASLIIGMAFFKFSPSAMIGNLYKDQRNNLDRLFVIFYVSINVGALFAYFSAAWLAVAFDWQKVFLMPAFGLFITIGLSLILFKNKNMNSKENHISMIILSSCIVGSIIVLTLLSILLNYSQVVIYVTPIVALLFIGIMTKQSSKLSINDKHNLIYILMMCIIAIFFFILYADQSTLITLYIEHMCQSKLLGITLKPSEYTGFDALWILLLSPLFSLFFKKIDKIDSKSSLMYKFGIGLVISAIGFAVIYFVTGMVHQLHSVNPIWVVLFFALQAAGEILISALGLSLMAKWAPEKLYNACMGGWFIVVALGSSIAGLFNSSLASINKGESALMIINHYQHAFLYLTVAALIIGSIILLSTKWICNKL